MKPTYLEPLLQPNQASRFVGEFLTSSHVQNTAKGSIEIRDGKTGKLIALLKKQVIPADIWQPAHEILRHINKSPTNRGTVTGGRGAMQKAITKTGELSSRLRVDPRIMEAAGNPKSDILGFYDYEQDRCGGTELTTSDPKWLGPEVMALFQKVNEIYAELLPEEYARQQEVVNTIAPSLMFDGTLYSTGTLNQRLRTAGHRDSGDHPEAVSALLATAAESGGEYIVVDYGLSFRLTPGDCLFTNARLVHGNLPFIGERQTTVLYLRERLHLCPQSAPIQ